MGLIFESVTNLMLHHPDSLALVLLSARPVGRPGPNIQYLLWSSNLGFWCKQAHRMEVLKPLTVGDVGLPAGNVLHMLRVDQVHFEPARFSRI